MPDVLFPTAKIHPGLHEDDHPLLAELDRRRISWACAIWDDPSVDWSSAKVSVIRSTWDYHRRRNEYVSWAKRAAALTSFWNPAPIIEWNTDKRYLRDLEQLGVPIVPTEWLAKGTKADLAAIAKTRGWTSVVVKPVVSAGAYGTIKADPAEHGAKGQTHLDALLAVEDVMVQPYLRTVEAHGERSMLFLDGELSHSVRKQPAFQPQTAEADPVQFSDEEARVARSIVAQVGKKFPGTSLLYSRVDLLPDEGGTYRLMELELTEPTLFLREGGAPAVKRLADGIQKRLR
jgi:glutathione synthase/RimK-type ligase-like ATP-grasp enzyme